MKEDIKNLLAIKMLPSGIKQLTRGQLFKNAERTGDDKAGVGSSWKEYWEICTQQDIPMICPFCGMPMRVDEVDGCHIHVAGALNGSWSVKKYIIPGHHRCNMQLGEEFAAKTDVKAVEATEK